MGINKIRNSSDAPVKKDIFTAIVLRDHILGSQAMQDGIMKVQPFLQLIGLSLKYRYKLMTTMWCKAKKGHQDAWSGHRQSFVISSNAFCTEPTKTCPSER